MNADDESILTRQYQNECRQYIDVADDLRSMGLSTIGITIVVAGDQSSGKSSVMEALSGVSLPRGEGVVTRCPLEMNLKMGVGEWRAEISYETRCSDDSGDTHRRITITDKSEVAEKIREAQAEITGQDVVISQTPIRLRIEAPDLPNLTLVDLPGIVHVENENQEGIIDLVSDLVDRYIKEPNTLILAILSAERDLETNVIITKARAVDPHGNRTIGVITKCDCIVGTHGRQKQLVATVTNSRYRISQFFFVKCRYPEDLTRAERLQEEREFFLNDAFYSRYNRSNLGVENMSRFLVQRLVTSIKESATEYLMRISIELRETIDEMESLPAAPSNDQVALRSDLSSSLKKFYYQLRDAIHCGYYRFTTEVDDTISKSLYVFWTESLQKLANDMLNHTRIAFEEGRFSAAFLDQYLHNWRLNVPEGFGHYKAYEAFIMEYVKDYSDFINHCLGENLEIMRNFLKHFLKEQFPLLMPHAPRVAEEVQLICEKHCKDCFRLTTKEVGRVIEMERHFLNLPRSVLSRRGAGDLVSNAGRGQSSLVEVGIELAEHVIVTGSATGDGANVETDIFRSSMNLDVKTLNERVYQNVGMCIRTKFYDGFIENIHEDLIDLRFNEDVYKQLRMDPHAARRSELDSKRQRLERAVDLLRTISRRED